MSEISHPACPQCGAPLPADAPGGLCPRCLMAVNMATQTVLNDEAPPSKAPKPPPPAPEEIAPHFPQLAILDCLGRGGMGVVYKARQKSLHRLVALKLLAPERANDPQFAARFEKEARALAALNHPNIVTVHDHGQAGGFYYLLMEFVDGVTLQQLLVNERISAREALAIVPQICDALQFAHDQGIVHRDIKPENILMDRRGRVKVADFGLAKIVGGNEPLTPFLSPSDGERVTKRGEGSPVLTDAGKVMGTPQYMSPEQIEAPGEVDHRADIYALGVVFYQMLTGELPGKKIEPPSRKVQIDVRLDQVVLRALERKPELRYQQATILKTEVETIASSSGRESARSERGQSEVEKLAYNPWETTSIAAGSIFFVAMLLLALEWTRPFRVPLIAISVLGLGICVLSIAGFWPFPSPLFPEPNFSSRNLRRNKTSGNGSPGGVGRESTQIQPSEISSRFSLMVVVGALSVIGFYAAMVAGLTVVSVLPFGGGLSPGLVAVLLMGLPLFVVVTSRWLKRSPSSTRSGWLKAIAWISWLLAIPVISLGVFFIKALLTSSGPWNPAPDEAVIVPLTWLGSLLLPVSGWVLWRAATSGSKGEEFPSQEPNANAGAPRNFLFAALSAVVLLLLAASGNAWVILTGSALLLLVGLAWFARSQWRIAILVALAAFGVATAIVVPNLLARRGGSTDPAQLAESPVDLRKLPTDRVIQAALAKPDSPWAWNELEKRTLTTNDAGQIIDRLTAWLQREYPSGPTTPVSWIDQFLERLDSRNLIGVDQKIRFLVALHGDLRVNPLGRVREGDHRLEVLGESRYIWRQHFLGLVMMNASFSASLDGHPVKFEGNFDDHWNAPHFGNVLTLPELTPGRHKLKLEVLSALAAKEDLAGLSSSAPPAEWPPAKKHWTRSTELEFTVYPRDAVIVAQTDDPALDPLSNGSLGIKPVLIRSKGDRAQAVVSFNVANSLHVPISFDVSLRVGDQTVACGTLWAVTAPSGGSSSGEEMTVELDRLAPELKTADVVLTPNPKPVEQRSSVDRIWGREVFFHQVRLVRQDLGEAATSVN